jgi:sulfite reductase (NADPH) flavoprotein alpha-component
VKLFANDLLEVLRKQPPRLYSLASSPLACPDEAHLCIAVVRYESHGREREGVCSTFFADRAPDDALVPVYIHSNNYFRLPENPATPVIMIGPGTGVAPFRAFLQHREATGADGRNWLFFGEQHFQTDFLYQAEWLQYLKSGVLTKLSVAFSRDQADKVYVQHRMREQATELYAWLEQGAHVYVCGDESRMAHDVHAALVEIVAQEGKRSPDEATEYVKNLQKANRYQRDVY